MLTLNYSGGSRIMARTIDKYPELGVTFTLTLDGDASQNEPLEMVRRDGLVGGWSHSGPVVSGLQTKSFMLMRFDFSHNLVELLRQLSEPGGIPPGQWRQAFKAAYPKYDRKGPIGVPDASWFNPKGNAHFPIVGGHGYTPFFPAKHRFARGGWRWLVMIDEVVK